MTDIDPAALKAINRAFKSRLRRHEVRQSRMGPLLASLSEATSKLASTAANEMTLEPTVQAIKALVKMEASLKGLPEQAKREEIEREKVLAAAKLRTASLKQWLEELS